MSLLCILCDSVGVLALIYIGYYIFDFVHLHVFRTTDWKQYNNGDKEQWAIVTGARGGLGKGYAVALAKKGFNLVLTARTKAQLESLGQQLETDYKIKCKCLAVNSDLSWEKDAVKKITKEVADLNVRVLINNVGVGTTLTDDFVNAPTDELFAIVNVNILFSTLMTKAFLELDCNKTRTKTERALIVNLSSASGVHPCPLLTPYSASKSYNDSFSRALRTEVQKMHIDVVSVTPYFVVSEMSGIRKPSLFVPDAMSFAETTFKKLSYGASLCPHWAHDVYLRACKILPTEFVSQQTYTTLRPVKAKQLKRMEQEGGKAE